MSAVNDLADQFYKDALERAEEAVDIYLTMTPLDLADLLKAELKEAPHSPVSLEIKRRLRTHCMWLAQETAQQIKEGD